MLVLHWNQLRALSFAGIAVAALAACGGGGGGNYGPGYNPGSGGFPTATPGPTAVPTSCATATAAPASGDAVFYLALSCTTAHTAAGYTVAGDANGLLIAASTADESVALAAAAVQTAPPTGSLEVAITAGESASSLHRQMRPPAVAAGIRPGQTALEPRRFAHVRAIANRKLAALLHSSSRSAAAAGSRKRAILPTAVGSTAGIWTLNASQQYVQVPSTLEYSATHGDIWVDNTLLATNGGPLTTTAIQTIGTDYDDAWAAVTPVIGTPDYSPSSAGAQETTDCTGGNPVPIFIPDPDDRQAVFVISSASNGNFGSYFDPANLVYSDVATQCLSAESNERSGFYVQYDLNSTTDTLAEQLAEDDLVLPANDLTHLIDFVGHTITSPGTGPTFLQTGYIDSPFIIEGLASFSEDLVIAATYPQMSIDVDDNAQSAQTYLADPPDFELTAFYGTDPNATATAGCNGCFGVAYLFARYAYDRFGASYPSAIVNSGLTGFSNLANAFGATTSPQNVIADFSVAMAVSGQGYSSDPRFNVAGFTTFGSYTDQTGQTVTLAGPTASGTQNVAADDTYAATVGSFLYLQLGGLPAAATVQVTDGHGDFGLEAALSQH